MPQRQPAKGDRVKYRGQPAKVIAGRGEMLTLSTGGGAIGIVSGVHVDQVELIEEPAPEPKSRKRTTKKRTTKKP